jgi:hypothetical protein
VHAAHAIDPGPGAGNDRRVLGNAERALLERLEDESLLERVFRVRTGVPVAKLAQAPEPSIAPRAAGLLVALRATDSGREALERARAGDVQALDALLDAPLDGACPPRLLHHLALFFGSAADGARGRDAGAERVAALELRALDAWALLLTEQRYLMQLAERVAGVALPRAELDAAIEAAALERVLSLGQRVTGGAELRTADARVALGLLRKVETHAFPRDAAEQPVRGIRAESARLARNALDTALAMLTDRFAQAEADADGLRTERAILSDAAQLYAWSQGDWYVALFTLERAQTTGWSVYKAKQWPALGELCEALRPMVDDAAQRVESDPSALPYSSLVAQMLVFRAEMGNVLATRIADAERALRLCDTHRNARVILADLLAERATVTLDGTGVLGRDAAMIKARADLDRADQLWAGLPRVANLRKRLDQMSGVLR